MRGRFNPRNGQFYGCGMFAWGGNQMQPGGFYRVRYTGNEQEVFLGHSVTQTTNISPETAKLIDEEVRRLFHSSPGREERQSPPARSSDQIGQLSHRSGIGAFTTRSRNTSSDVENALSLVCKW